MNDPDYKCPVCNHVLSITIDANRSVMLYCGYGKCPSDAMNVGVEAPTAAKAFEMLEEIAANRL